MDVAGRPSQVFVVVTTRAGRNRHQGGFIADRATPCRTLCAICRVTTNTKMRGQQVHVVA